MLPYRMIYIDNQGVTKSSLAISVTHAQQIAVDAGASVYKIMDTGGVAVYELTFNQLR